MKTINFTDDIERLNIIHIFEYYDHPLFYIAQNKELDNFLFYFVDDNPYSTWLVSQVSMNEVNSIKNKKTNVKSFLNHLFKKQRLFKIQINQGKILDDLTELITEENIDLNDFPEEDFEVEFDYITNTPLEKHSDSQFEEVKYLKLTFVDANNSHSIPAATFKNVIVNLENYIKHTTNHLSPDSKIPSLNLLALPASSFGAEFEVILEETMDLDQISSQVTSSLVDFIGDLETVDEKELSDQIFIEQRYTPKEVVAIQKITESAIDSGYELILEAKDENKQTTKKSTITRNNKNKINKIDSALRLNNQNTSVVVEITATVIAASLKSKTFWLDISELEDKSMFENKNDFNGRIDENLVNKLNDSDTSFAINVPSKITAKIKIDTIIDYTQSKSKDYKYSLLSFSI